MLAARMCRDVQQLENHNMMVVRLQINRFRCIQSLTMFPDRQNLLIGENDAGKTTILEALVFCLGINARECAILS